MTTYDVAVLGFGPVGATLANLLALRGLRVLVVEREADIYPLPRAIQLDGETMRVFQTVGIAEELEPTLRVASRMHFIDAEGHTLIDWRRPTDIKPQGWNTSYRFHQPTLEAALRRRLADHSNVTVLLQHEVTALIQDGECVTISVTDLTTGDQEVVSSSFVVGCDGARSLVRQSIGAPLDDLRSHERWLVVDCLLEPGATPDLDDESVQYCDPRRPATYVPGPQNRRRWELMLLPHEDAMEMTRPERVWELLAPWLSPREARIERPAVYTFHSVVASQWKSGRVLLAGDACHQTPPFMGQGMCAGIRDAANVAWKVSEVVSGRARPDLLDTYESERSPHVRTFIETAVRLGAVISTTDVEVARERDLRMRANPEGFTTPAPRLGPGAWDARDAAAGHVSEQPFMADGTRLDDLVGYDWALFALPEAAEAALDGRRRGLCVITADSESGRDWLRRLGAVAVLVRPDRYVAGTTDSPDGIGALLQRGTNR